MVKVHLAFLLLGLGATQALVADNDRNRHWAEGVYFPPEIGVDVIPKGITQPLNLTLPRHRKQNPWSTQSRGGIYNEPHTPQSLGYPADQYNPYQATESVEGRYNSGQSELYVPEYYSSTISGENEAENTWIKYRDKEHWGTESQYRDRYYSDSYNETNSYYMNEYYNDGYDNSHSGRVINTKPGQLSVYEIPRSYTTVSRPYVPGLGGMEHSGDYGNTFVPWGLIFPFSDAEIPLLPLW